MMDENKDSFLEKQYPGKSEKGLSYSAGFFMLIAFGVGCNILGGVVAIPIIAWMSGESITFISENLKEMLGMPHFFREMQVLQSLTTIIGFFVSTLLVASRLSSRPLTLTGLRGRINFKNIGLTVLIIGCGLALSSALGYFTYKLPFPVNWRIIFDRLENNYAEAALGIINLSSVQELIISIIVLALVPAICEETFFRGGLQNYMYRSTGKLWVSVVAVSLIFSAVHFSIYGFLSRVALGIILGLLYQYSGRLWLSILAHFINNAMAVLMMYIQSSKGKPIEDIIRDRDGSYWGFIIIPLIILLFIQYKRSTAPNITTTDGV